MTGEQSPGEECDDGNMVGGGGTLGWFLVSCAQSGHIHLVAWMMDRFGVDTVVELYSRLDPDLGKDEAISTLEEVLGLPITSLAEEYELAHGTVYASKWPFSCGASIGELA